MSSRLQTMCDEHLDRAIVLAEYAANKPECQCGCELDYCDGALCAECEWRVDHDQPPLPRGSRGKASVREARRKRLVELERERAMRKFRGRLIIEPPPEPMPAPVVVATPEPPRDPVTESTPVAIRRRASTSIAALNSIVGERMRRLRQWARGGRRMCHAS